MKDYETKAGTGQLTKRTKGIGYSKTTVNTKEIRKVPVVVDKKTTIYVLPEEVEGAVERYLEKRKLVIR